MDFRILGPLEVIGPDGPLLLRGAKRRGLLAFLLVHRGQVISSDRLVEAISDGDERSGAPGTVQTYLSQLRKILPPIGAGLVTQPSGYVFDVPNDAIDAARFEAMVRAAGSETDSGSRLRLLDGALGLWRGAALEEFAWPWAITERSRLDRRRLEALSLRAATRLERGEHLDALGELDALTDEYPLDERLCSLRMLAAYRAGRQAEALRAFQSLRRRLAEELGVEPSPELVELERRVLDHDPGLRADSARVPHVVDRDAEPVAGTHDVPRGVRHSPHLHLGLSTVAVLISDLVGSASMRTSLGDHRADEIERWHEGILEKAVGDYQGTIVKRLGDGAMAIFATATDAVAAAAAIQTRLTRERTAREADLRVRIGLSAGEVVVEEDDVRGQPPTEAARLCARAEGGQILATQLVQYLAAARSAATLRAAGVYDLKGLPGPVPVYEVLWPVGGKDRVPLPDSLAAFPREFSFVGRERELDVLADTWHEACATSALGTLLVCGEAGAGKSRLVAEFAHSLASGSASPSILHGRCDEVARYPFQPITEWLRHYLALAAPADVGMLRSRHGVQLSRLVPELVSARVEAGRARPRVDPGDPFPLYEAVLGWLTLAGDAGPLLLVIDDLQWASRPTLAVLEHLIAASPRVPGMLVVTYRDDDVPEKDVVPLAGWFGAAEEGIERLQLEGLAPDDVATIVREAHGTAPIDDVRALAREIHAESGGNPLFVTSLTQHVEPAHRQPARPREHQGPPDRIVALVLDRLTHLEPATVEVLQQAAVAGPEFEFSLLKLIAGDEGDRLLDLLSDAVDAHYLIEMAGKPLRYQFAHGVVRSALVETVPVAQRMRLHRLAGLGLEQLGRAGDDRTIASLAHHFSEAAALGEADRAIEYCRRAAEVATQQLAHDEAVRWYEKALEIVDAEGGSESVRYDLFLELGRARARAGHRRARASLFSAYRVALALGDHERAADAVLSLNRGFFARTGETDDEAVEALESMLALITEEDAEGTRAMLMAALAAELVWADDGDRRFALSDDALTIARRLGDQRTLARVLALRNMTILAPDTLRERTANCYELLGLAEALQDDVIRFDAAFDRGGTALEAGDAGAAHDMVEAAAAVADKLRQPRLLWQARLMQTAQAVFRGALDDASFYADDGLDLGRRAGQGGEALLFQTEQMLEIRRWQGRLAEHLDLLKPFAGQPGWDLGHAITRYLYEAGETDDAAHIYREIASVPFLPLRRDMLVAPSLYNLAFLASRVGDAVTAGGLYEALRPYADAFANTTVPKPVGWHVLGTLAATAGNLDAAESCLRKAVHVHDAVGAPLFRAESETELARLLLALGRRDEAAALLHRARQTAASRGAGLLLQQCDAMTR